MAQGLGYGRLDPDAMAMEGLVSNVMGTGQRNGDGRLDGDGNERLSYGRLGNGRCNGLAMDGLMAT